MSFFKTIGDAIYREYDRRIKRASLVTEYGAHHHAHATTYADAHPHADATNEDAAHASHGEEAEEAEIVNVPRGTVVASGHGLPAQPQAHTTAEQAEASGEK
jgi:hypothetical protein